MESVAGAAACSARVFSFFFCNLPAQTHGTLKRGGFASTSLSLSTIEPTVAVLSGCVDTHLHLYTHLHLTHRYPGGRSASANGVLCRFFLGAVKDGSTLVVWLRAPHLALPLLFSSFLSPSLPLPLLSISLSHCLSIRRNYLWIQKPEPLDAYAYGYAHYSPLAHTPSFSSADNPMRGEMTTPMNANETVIKQEQGMWCLLPVVLNAVPIHTQCSDHYLRDEASWL